MILESTETVSALEAAIDALRKDAQRAEKAGEYDVARDIDEYVFVLLDMLDNAEIVEPAAQPETVLIVVKGGLVQSASATIRDLNIIVQDLDNLPDAQERGEGDCSWVEAHTVMSADEIEQQIQDNIA